MKTKRLISVSAILPRAGGWQVPTEWHSGNPTQIHHRCSLKPLSCAVLKRAVCQSAGSISPHRSGSQSLRLRQRGQARSVRTIRISSCALIFSVERAIRITVPVFGLAGHDAAQPSVAHRAVADGNSLSNCHFTLAKTWETRIQSWSSRGTLHRFFSSSLSPVSAPAPCEHRWIARPSQERSQTSRGTAFLNRRSAPQGSTQPFSATR